MRVPSAFVARRRIDAGRKRDQAVGGFLETVGQDVAFPLEIRVHEALDVVERERRALDLHRVLRLRENRSMCYGDDARPPLPPISGAAADHGDVRLTSSDGTELMAYFARAAKPTGAGMVVLPDVRGLHQFFKELAQRFAEAGIDSRAFENFPGAPSSADRWARVKEL